ncbi:MAG: HAD family hydrolase [Limisphaerales bacterium]
MKPGLPIDPNRFRAVLFDLDGVLTATAKVHAVAWKELFDGFLERWSREHRIPFQPFSVATDYTLYVDGKSRNDGVISFLESRGIRLPPGDPGDPPGHPTVEGLAGTKDEIVHELLARDGVEVYPGAIALVRSLKAHGVRTAVVSSSRNCQLVLRSAGIEDLFDVRVDGEVAVEQSLPGKPRPDMFLHAARRLGVAPGDAVVVEDALAGVRAGRAGGFGLVVGVARGADEASLREAGADVVVNDLSEWT